MVPSKPCSYPGCSNYAIIRGRCDLHKFFERKKSDIDRGNSGQRGYTHGWREMRLVKLSQFPLCQRCLQKNPPKETPATMVHHIKPIEEYPELRLDIRNMQSLCFSCHEIIEGRKGEKRY